MRNIKKSLPSPLMPSELFWFYFFEFKKALQVFYRFWIKDPFRTVYKNRFSALLKLQNKKYNSPCFVFANGPSLSKLEPEKVKRFCVEHGAEIYCVNYFPNSTFAETTGFDYWILSDPKTFDLTDERVQRSFINAKKMLRNCIFIPIQYYKTLQGQTDHSVIAFNDFETSGVFCNSINPSKPRSYVSMTAYKALAIAAFLGHSPIYICGFDNTYIRNLGCDQENRIYRLNEHFEEKAYPNTNPKQLLNYQHKTVADELISNSRLFSDLRKFNKFNIINLDTESLTDAFKKSDSIDVFKEI